MDTITGVRFEIELMSDDFQNLSKTFLDRQKMEPRNFTQGVFLRALQETDLSRLKTIINYPESKDNQIVSNQSLFCIFTRY